MKNGQVEPNIEGSLTVGMIAGLVLLSSGFSAKSFSGSLRKASILSAIGPILYKKVMTKIIPA
jgi:hypothetical protein